MNVFQSSSSNAFWRGLLSGLVGGLPYRVMRSVVTPAHRVWLSDSSPIMRRGIPLPALETDYDSTVGAKLSVSLN
jgi:hypothetical protein